MSYKIGIVGAARRHQGTGPFIAKIFNQLGHNITGVIGTTNESSAQASTQLERQYGIKTQGYTCLENLLSENDIDILVISSPSETHLAYLREALNNQLHVFCEKPLWWPISSKKIPESQEYLSKIQSCLDIAKENQCIIHLNTQWPYTLPYFYRLYPDLELAGINHFSMNLSPQSNGVSMIVDAAPHGLSMLYQLVGQGDLTHIVFNHNSDEHVNASFHYEHQAGLIKVSLDFTRSQATPKPASYMIDKHKVDRIVSLPEYQIKLQSDQCCVTIRDPLLVSIEDFIASIQAGLQTDPMLLMSGCQHLHQLIESYK